MTIKQKLLSDINHELPASLLEEVYLFVQRLKQSSRIGNRDRVLSFAGILSDQEAQELKLDRAEAFGRLEGEWQGY